MRIIAGTRKAMRLVSPIGEVSRPITDRVKEAVFNILADLGLPAGANVADIFSGVGSLGLEALSRGAEFVLFVEKDAGTLAALKKNVEKTGFTDKCRLSESDVFRQIPPDFAKTDFQLVFVDPPFADTSNMQKDSPMARLITNMSEYLTTAAVVVLRTDSPTKPLQKYARLDLFKTRKWGINRISMYRKKPDVQ